MTPLNTSVLLIYTGGTIGMIENTATGALENFNFEQLQRHIPELQKFNFPIDTYQFDPPMDSSDMEPDMWRKLVHIIHENYDLYHGFVILHGTDTMAYTASALSFMLEGLDKPVILTGSQLPIGVLRTDGKENLMTSIEIAAAQDKEGKALVPEVCIYFQNKLFRANRTTKHSAELLNAFRSDNYPALAEVGVNITFHRDYIHRPAHADAELRVAAALDDRVLVIRLFPGLREQVLRAMLSIEGLLALTLMIPLLTIYADLMGVLGGFVVGTLMLNLNSMEYANATVQMVPFKHVLIGLVYGTVFGVIVALAGCYQGLRCGRSAQAVGRATTTAVVHAIVGIIVATSIITVICNVLQV